MSSTDVLILGSGLSGCTAALAAAEKGLSVCIVTKMPTLHGGSTSCAQGGIIYRGDGDSAQLLIDDILQAGQYASYLPAVQTLAHEGPELVKKWLIDRMEVPFAREANTQQLKLTREAAHSTNRILYCGDRTGYFLHQSIINAVLSHPKIKCLTEHVALDLLTTNHHSVDSQDLYREPRCFGALLFDLKNQSVEPLFAQHTVVATGGLGQLYLHTTNPPESRGDGVAMAWRAGARCINLHVIQFHPTAIYHPSGRFLVSEAVRGEGGVLIDAAGREFMYDSDPRGSMAPRDVVARAIHNHMRDQHTAHVYLDITHKPKAWLQERFPSIFQRCLELDIKMDKEPIPVVPAAHYAIGGIAADLDGATSIKRLYAIGEVACTGIHGLNRLASTSLLECLVWGNRVAAVMASDDQQKTIPSIRPWDDECQEMDAALIAQDWQTIRHIMWNYVGLSRTPKRLQRACTMLRELQLEVDDFYRQTRLSDSIIGLRNGVQTALAIALQAKQQGV